MISVCINTKNRPKDLSVCLKYLLKSSYKDFEVLVADQSREDDINKNLKNIIKIFKLPPFGVSKAKNFLIKKAKGEIVAFTDDDCIITKDWLANIKNELDKHKEVIGLFGKVFPYQKNRHKLEICPCTFNNKQKIIIKPTPHWKNIGFGNNMAFKKEIFNKIGNFRGWLGPGSIGDNAEDAEFALRCLVKGYKLLSTPKVIVYHNKWLSGVQYKKQILSYVCGEMSCYGYFGFQGFKLGKEVVLDNLKNSYWKFRTAIKQILFFKKNSFKLTINTFEELICRIRGLLVGCYYSYKEPI